MILDGKAVAQKVLAEVRDGVGALQAAHGITPGLAVVLVGTDPASAVYVRSKKNTAASVGITSPDYVYPEGLTQRALLELIDQLNADPSVHGILVQLPLPKGLDEDEIVRRIDPHKDVDGLTPTNLGQLLAGAPAMVPCTPAGCLEVLGHYGATLAGAEAVVVGRSRLVGKPLAQLLLRGHATVTMCHTRTRDLAFHTRRADILCVAAGRPRMITGDMIKPGAWVIDVGVNRLETGKLAGDVDFESAARVAHAITPVPGGIGPMTIAMLMKNTLISAEGAVEAPSATSPIGLRGQSPRSDPHDHTRATSDGRGPSPGSEPHDDTRASRPARAGSRPANPDDTTRSVGRTRGPSPRSASGNVHPSPERRGPGPRSKPHDEGC